MIDPETPFTEDEVRALIRRAAARQVEAERGTARVAEGLRLSEVQEIASEAGISAPHVLAAARELLLRRDQAPPRMRLGIPDALGDQRVLPGDISDATWGRIVAELRSTFRRNGIATQFGAVREWVSSNESTETMPVRLRLDPDDDGTVVTVQQAMNTVRQLPLALGGTFTGLAAALAVLFAVGDFPTTVLAVPGLLAGAGAASFGLSLLAGRRYVRRQRERIAAALDRIELVARSSRPDG